MKRPFRLKVNKTNRDYKLLISSLKERLTAKDYPF